MQFSECIVHLKCPNKIFENDFSLVLSSGRYEFSQWTECHVFYEKSISKAMHSKWMNKLDVSIAIE